MASTQYDLVGTLLEQRYRIDGAIARGGMSTVYRGLDTRLDRPVAIKVMDPTFAADPQFVQRFELEARTVAKLKHPALVAVYDQGHDRDHAFLVMELVEGGTLRQLLTERGPMPPHAVRAVAEPVLDALGVAHRAGLVHRDVKPENVLISESGEVKIADFGLVRAMASATTTSKNVILGTAAYLSPEQVTDGTADARSDVYQFGILLFELLTGTTPFTGDTSISIAYQRIEKDVPPPSSLISGVPPQFDALVATATHRDPAQRFPDAAIMADNLRAIAAELELPPYRVPAPAHRPAPAPTVNLAQPAPPVQPLPPRPTRVETRYTGLQPSASAQLPYAPPPQYAPPTSAQPAKSHKAYYWIAAIVALALTLGLAGWYLGSGNDIAIPSVDGMTKQKAIATVQDAGFTADEVTQYSDSRPAGQVLGTDPAFGSSAPKGSTVDILISGGPPTVPNIAPGTSLEDAEKQIRAMGLNPVVGPKVYNKSVPAGSVVRVNPKPGTTVPTKSTVKITISQGTASGTMPDLAGSDVQQATAEITSLGAKVGTITTQDGKPVTSGHIISTDPAAGDGIGPDTTVNLIVDGGVKVPLVIGSRVDNATRRLESLGFNVEVTHQLDGGDRAFVTGQDPASGATATPGSTVNLVAFP